MDVKWYSIWLLLLLVGVACRPQYLDKEALRAYLLDESNGLSSEVKVGAINAKVTYRPTELLALQSVGQKAVNKEEMRRHQQRFDEYVYFILSLEAMGKDALYGTSQNQQDFSNKLQTLSFRMGNYVQLTTALGDTIPVADYIYQRNFGMEGSSSLMFAFNREKALEQPWVSFDLEEFGLGIGNRRFRFETKDILNAPKLKIDNEQSI